MRRLLCVWCVLCPVSVFAQAAPTDRLQWDQAAASVAAANAYRYDVEVDGAVASAPLVVTCTGSASPVVCTAAIPPVTPGAHTVRLRAVDTSAGTPIIGPWSSAFTFTMRAVPAAPQNVRILPGS